MFGEFLSRVDTHLCRFEGLKTVSHGSLEDLLHFIWILGGFIVTAAVRGTVLLKNRRNGLIWIKLDLDEFFPLGRHNDPNIDKETILHVKKGIVLCELDNSYISSALVQVLL